MRSSNAPVPPDIIIHNYGVKRMSAKASKKKSPARKSSSKKASAGKAAANKKPSIFKRFFAAIKQAFKKNDNANVKFSIRYKILLSFIVPIVFIVVIGVAAYQKAESGMREKYEASTKETIKMAASQVDLVASYVKGDATKYAFDKELNKLVKGFYDGDTIRWKNINDQTNSALMSSKTGNSFVGHIHIITPSNLKMYSTKTITVDGIFDQYIEFARDPENERTVIGWIDSHPLIDEAMGFKPSDEFLMAYQALAEDRKYVVVIDISKSAMQNFVDEINLGEGSFVGLVTAGGTELLGASAVDNELLKDSPMVVDFAKQDFFRQARTEVEGGSESGVIEITYGGQKCLFFYAPCEVSGSMMVALVPLGTVTAQAKSISVLTIIMVGIALIVVLSIGFVITATIQNNVQRVSGSLNEVAKGDLTVGVNVRGRDEFQSLAGAANDMVSNTKKLVSKVDAAAGGLEESAEDVTKASEILGACSEDISDAISLINKGMERQSRHASEVVDTTDHLSDEIRNVSIQVEKVKVILKETNDMISESVKIIRTLGDKALETTKATDAVGDSVKALTDETMKINSFVGVIKKISSQTRLLSLNASIEAARAGESGRGFVVVADQIRNLADDSSNAAGEINKLVDGINSQAESSAISTEQARDIVDEQSELVNRSIGIFNNMQESIETLIGGLGSIDSATLAADARRAEAVNAVRNIADIIKDNANNIQVVMDVAVQLKQNIDNLNRTAKRLDESMDEMKSEVAVFKI